MPARGAGRGATTGSGRVASLGERAIRAALRRGARQGLGDGSKPWMVVGAAALTIRVLQRISTPKPVVVAERLEPGQTLVIRHLRPGE